MSTDRLDRARTVFINCPPGEDMRDLRQGLPLAVVANGFQYLCDFDSYVLYEPRRPRLHILADHIAHARYSIHVCDRCEAENPEQTGRFHIPVELGMALFERRRTDSESASHEILILIREDRPYANFLSNEWFGECRKYSDCDNAINTAFNWLRGRQLAPLRPKLAGIAEVWEQFKKQRPSLEALQNGEEDLDELALQNNLLNLLEGKDWWKEKFGAFDVFLAYNNEDKQEVRAVNSALRGKGLKTWFDEDHMLLGRSIRHQLELAIPKCRSAAILLGKHGLGKWQSLELDAILSFCLKENLPIIPVLLPSANDEKVLPPFLQGFLWVNIKNISDEKAVDDFVAGIRGHRESFNF